MLHLSLFQRGLYKVFKVRELFHKFQTGVSTPTSCNGTAEIKECRVNTLLKICNALGVGLSDLINDALPEAHPHYYIDDSVILNTGDLPRPIRSTIKELEEYDEKHDPMFFECADMLYMMADRFLKDGAIDTLTHDKLILKYPIA